MRKEFGKSLRALFCRAMKEKFPLFNEVKVTSLSFQPGQWAFLRIVSQSLHLWIVLAPSPKDYDEFTVLVGWSRLGRYPELSMIPSFRLPEEGQCEFEEVEYFARLPFLRGREDRWWVIREPMLALTTEALMKQMEPIPPEEAQRLTAPLVEDAVRKLQECAVPYFEALIARGDGEAR